MIIVSEPNFHGIRVPGFLYNFCGCTFHIIGSGKEPGNLDSGILMPVNLAVMKYKGIPISCTGKEHIANTLNWAGGFANAIIVDHVEKEKPISLPSLDRVFPGACTWIVDNRIHGKDLSTGFVAVLLALAVRGIPILHGFVQGTNGYNIYSKATGQAPHNYDWEHSILQEWNRNNLIIWE